MNLHDYQGFSLLSCGRFRSDDASRPTPCPWILGRRAPWSWRAVSS